MEERVESSPGESNFSFEIGTLLTLQFDIVLKARGVESEIATLKLCARS